MEMVSVSMRVRVGVRVGTYAGSLCFSGRGGRALFARGYRLLRKQSVARV